MRFQNNLNYGETVTVCCIPLLKLQEDLEGFKTILKVQMQCSMVFDAYCDISLISNMACSFQFRVAISEYLVSRSLGFSMYVSSVYTLHSCFKYQTDDTCAQQIW